MSLFILNPGDGHDVLTYDNQSEALTELHRLESSTYILARLYSVRGGEFFMYDSGNWYQQERNALPLKVIRAGLGGLTDE